MGEPDSEGTEDKYCDNFSLRILVFDLKLIYFKMFKSKNFWILNFQSFKISKIKKLN